MVPSRTPVSSPRNTRHKIAPVKAILISEQTLMLPYFFLDTIVIVRTKASAGTITTFAINCRLTPIATIKDPNINDAILIPYATGKNDRKKNIATSIRYPNAKAMTTCNKISILLASLRSITS